MSSIRTYKKYLLLISLMLPLLFIAGQAKADSENTWLIKTKTSGTVYTLWMDGQITSSEAEAEQAEKIAPAKIKPKPAKIKPKPAKIKPKPVRIKPKPIAPKKIYRPIPRPVRPSR